MGDPQDNEEDPRLANTFMDSGDAGAGAGPGEEDPRLANTFMAPGDEEPGDLDEEDPRLANTFMPEGGPDADEFDEEDPRLANTFMDPGLAPPSVPAGGDMKATRVDRVAARSTAQYRESVAPDMTFMDAGPVGGGGGSDLDEVGADMTFMDAGRGRNDLDESGADMTFMDPGADGGGSGPSLDESGAEMTFMDAGTGGISGADAEMTLGGPAGPGGGDLPTMNVPHSSSSGIDGAESDQTFVSMDSQEGMVSSPSLSGARSQTNLRTQRFGGKVAMSVEDEGLFAGKYKLLGELARGGMGVVYKALHVDLNQIVALKLMLAGANASDDHRRRFLFEAEASARLKHANIVPVFDVGTVEGNLYFTMAFVKGEELKARKEELARDKLLDVMIKVTDAISFAHQRGIIHRDLKPANIMMTEGDEPLVMDFGLAKQLDEQEKEDEALEESELAKTTEGAIMGTPYYMSPEQAQGMTHEIDTRTDTYALGVILYQLWTKKLPFTARRATEILQKIVNDDAPRPRQIDPTVPQDMEAIILKAMDKVPDKRYASAAALKDDLVRLKTGEPVSAQRATVGYRLKKWAQRNKQQLIAASIVFSVMLGSIVALGYQAYAAKVRQAGQVTLAINGAHSELEALAPAWKSLEDDVKAHLAATSGGIAEREEALEALAARQAKLADEVRAAAQPLGPYVDSDLRAGQVQGLADDTRRDLEARREDLRRMSRVHGALAEGDQFLADLKVKLPAALAALGSAAKVKPVSFATLSEGTAAGRKLLGKTKDSGQVSLGETLDAQRAELEALLKQLQVKVYAGFAEAPVSSPEAMHARQLLTRADAVLAKLDAARARFNEQRLAQELFQVSNALQALLVVEEAPPSKRRRRSRTCSQCKLMLMRSAPTFESADEAAAHIESEHKLLFPLPPRSDRPAYVAAALVSRDLINRALQLAPTPEIEAAAPGANAAYVLSLLYMQAYKVFDVAIREPGAVDASTQERLVAAKKRQLAQRAYLRRQIFGTDGLSVDLVTGKVKVRGGGQTGAKIFGYMSSIGTLKKLATHPLLDDELDQVRLEKLKKKESELKVLKEIYAKEKAAKKAAREKAAREKAGTAPPK